MCVVYFCCLLNLPVQYVVCYTLLSYVCHSMPCNYVYLLLTVLFYLLCNMVIIQTVWSLPKELLSSQKYSFYLKIVNTYIFAMQ